MSFNDERWTYAFLALALLPAVLVANVLWVAPVEHLTADRSAMAARDFTSMWAAGRMVAEGHLSALFERAAFNAELRAMFGAGFANQVWSYPPPGLLLAVPFSILPFLPGLVAWTGGTLALLWLALRGGGLSPRLSAAVLCSPAVADNALTGQNGALTGSLLIGGLLLAGRHPALAGALLGGLIIKPQFGLLVPVCLAASRNWRAFWWAAASAGAIAVLSGWLFGFGTWVDFFTRTQPALTAMMREPWEGLPAQRIFASPLMAARSLGASLTVATAVQAVAALLCAVVAWRAWRRPDADPVLRAALTAPLALIAAPWVHTYDMAPLAAAIAILYWAAPRPYPVALGFAWFWPGAAVLVPIPIAIEVASIAGVAWVAWLRMRAPRDQTGGPAGSDRLARSPPSAAAPRSSAPP